MDLPDQEALGWIVKTFAHLRAAHGNAIGSPLLVQPTGEFFPDPFESDAASLDRFLKRMLGYAPLSDELHVELALLMPEEGQGGGCGAAACGPGAASGPAGMNVRELDDGYRVIVSASDLGNADVLATSLARSMGSLVLLEAGEPLEADASEIAAVSCGFGVLLANGASVWAKSCGGLRMAQATVLPVEQIAVALALFVAIDGRGSAGARRHLGATQREAFELAWDWVESNPLMIESLRDEPRRLESGVLDLEPVRGVLGQWLHKRKLEKAMRVQTKAAEPMTEERRRRLERMKEVSSLFDLPD
ncbi:MAG TPA: hypothetical protein VII82_02150 [Polyangiaceae bacterium]|jgi:hypothetical protein